jgi:hypothetical protein
MPLIQRDRYARATPAPRPSEPKKTSLAALDAQRKLLDLLHHNVQEVRIKEGKVHVLFKPTFGGGPIRTLILSEIDSLE